MCNDAFCELERNYNEFPDNEGRSDVEEYVAVHTKEIKCLLVINEVFAHAERYVDQVSMPGASGALQRTKRGCLMHFMIIIRNARQI